jgi:hypothetical protein
MVNRLLAIKAGEPGFDLAILISVGVCLGTSLLLLGLLYWAGRLLGRRVQKHERRGFEVKLTTGSPVGPPVLKQEENDHG